MKPCEEILSRCPPPPDQAGQGETAVPGFSFLVSGSQRPRNQEPETRNQKPAESRLARLARLLAQAFALLVGYLDAGDFEARKIFWHWYRRAPDGSVVLRPVGGRRRAVGGGKQKPRGAQRRRSTAYRLPPTAYRRRSSPDAELRKKIKGLFMAFKRLGKAPPAELRAWSAAELRPLKQRNAPGGLECVRKPGRGAPAGGWAPAEARGGSRVQEDTATTSNEGPRPIAPGPEGWGGARPCAALRLLDGSLPSRLRRRALRPAGRRSQRAPPRFPDAL